MNWYIFYAMFGGITAAIAMFLTIASSDSRDHKAKRFWIFVMIVEIALLSYGVTGLNS